MAFPPSLGRIAEHDAMRRVTLHGSVIDLGGGRDSGYRTIFKGEYTTTSANLDGHETTDIHCNLENPLPIADASYDGVLMINTLEHIYHCHELVNESFRIMKHNGVVVIAVPFLFPVHPSPSDFWRFTAETLHNLLRDAGYTEIEITPLAPGVFINRFILLERLLPQSLRVVMFYCVAPVARFMDRAFTYMSKLLKRKYEASSYPGAYLAVAKKYVS